MTVYLNNAATSYPKPKVVASAIVEALGAIPPAEHRSNLDFEAADVLSSAREKISGFFNLREDDSLVFTSGGTEALNLAIRGLLRPGDHTITTASEHNAVLRPVRWLERHQGVKTTVVPSTGTGWVDPRAISEELQKQTRAVIITHISNTTGAIQDIGAASSICREAGVLLIVDGCQSAGNTPVDFQSLGCDAFVFTGHKGMLGPPGIGGVLMREHLQDEIHPLILGGAGYAAEEEIFVDEFPAKFEVGTRNYPGLAGLATAVNWIEEQESFQPWKPELGIALADAVDSVAGARVIRPDKGQWHQGIVSFVVDGLDSREIEGFLWEDGEVICRAGYCCAPLVHGYLGSEGSGIVRLSIGRFNSQTDIDTATNALEGVCRLAV